jgi:3-oxoadipate enol-lactonase
MTTERVAHHGRETAYRIADRGATGPTCCFVHGSGANKAIWKSQHRLADEYRVVALDLSGHGDSDDVDADAGYEALSAYADDVQAVVDATDADVVVGNSLGGAVTLELLLDRDHGLDAAVLAGSGAKLAVLADLLDWLESDFERAVEFLHEPDHLLHTDDERVHEASIEAMHAAGRATTERDFRTCHEFDVRDRLDEIDLPVLAVVGEHDKLTPPRYHEYLVDEIESAELAVVEEAAHLAMLEQPEAFNTALDAFLSRRV